MNETILEKARELGELISLSPEYRDMRDLEEDASADPGLSDLYAQYADLRDQIRALSLEDGAEEQVDQLNGKAGEVEEQINAQDKMKRVNQARAAFSVLMDRINGTLQAALTGEEEYDYDAVCGSGGCEGCQGCSVR